MKKGITTTKTFIFVVLAAALVFATSIVRGQCISKGYELSQMVSLIEERRLQVEKAEAEATALLSKERLYKLASERNFVIRQEGKTYNVEQ